MEDRVPPRGENLEDELRSIKKAFEVLLLAIEAEGIESATEIAGRIMTRLDHLIREIRTDYVQRVLDERFQPFAVDQKRFNELTAGSERPSPDAVVELISRIENHISTVDREMRVLTPRRPRTFTWIVAKRKAIGLAGVGVVFLFGIWSGVRSVLTQGKGLVGEYFTGTNFRKAVRKRRDLTIDFSFRNQPPVRGLTGENYSVRWTGSLRIPEDGTYEFITRSDDGVRLWIEDQLLIDNWTVHKQMTDKATREFTAGNKRIKLEWFQRRGPAMMQLYWRSAGDPRPVLIESDYLIPE